MAQTAVAIQTVVEAGVTPTSAAADTVNGNSVANSNGDVFLLMENAHVSSSETFTVAVQKSTANIAQYGDIAMTAQAYAVAASSKILAGPFPAETFNDANGNILISYTGSGTPKISAFKLNRARIVG
jgi:hypothetical protein